MAEPCCPDRAGQRGRPYTPHWFVLHDDTGAINWWSTWQFGGFPRNDLECATALGGMFEQSGAHLLWGEQTHRWYMWDGTGRYAAQPDTFSKEMTLWAASALRQALSDVLSVIEDRIRGRGLSDADVARRLKETADAWRPHSSFVTKVWGDTGQRAVRSIFSDVCTTDVNRMDDQTGQVIVDNGVIDYDQVRRDGYVVLQPHDHRVRVTRRTGRGMRWEPDARCPVFEQFLRDSVQDPDQRDWLLWRVASSLFGKMPRKGFANLIGERDSGKSTFTDIMAHIAGDYAKSVPVDTFLSKRSGDQGFQAHELMGARFVHTHEPNPGALYDVGFMKHLTGRVDRMRTRTLYEKPVEWLPQCTPFIGSNNPIRFSTSDDAMMERQEAVLFQRGYARAEPDLPDRMRAERDGILRLLVSYIEREAVHGVPELPFSMIELRERMAVATEDALEFVAEWISEGRLIVSSEAPLSRCVQVNQLYGWYKSWCDEAGVKAIGRNTLSAVVGRKYTVRKSNGKRFSSLVAKQTW